MKLYLEASALARELALLGPIGGRTKIAACDHFHLKAEKDSLTLQATDLVQVVTTTIPAGVAEPGAILAPPHLAALVRNLSGRLELETSAAHWMQLSAEGVSSKLPGLDPADYPKTPRPGGKAVTIPGPAFAELLARTLIVAQRQEGKLSYPWIRLRIAGGRLSAVATDGHRASYASAELKGARDTGEPDLLIPVAVAVALKQAWERVETSGAFELRWNERQVELALGDVVVTWNRPDGSMPNVDRLFEVPQRFVTIELKRERLALALARVGVVGETAKLRFLPEGLRLEATSVDKGHVEDLVPLVGELKRGSETGCSIPYLLQFLGTEKAEELHVAIDPSDQASLMRFYRGSRPHPEHQHLFAPRIL